jgi:hypothetical protein
MAKRAACEVSVGRDMNGSPLSTCDRVEISPHFDLWMRGARFGVVKRRSKDGHIFVKMDNRGVRRVQKMKPADVKKVR